MAVVVLVQRRREDAERYAEWLRGRGHTFQFCGGPAAPGYTCEFWREGSCSLWETGQLFIYDAWLDKSQRIANSDELVAALRGRYPDKPLVLVGPNAVTPSWVERLMRADPLVRAVFPVNPNGLVAAVSALVGPSQVSAAGDDFRARPARMPS